jgi:hypothetical protein
MMAELDLFLFARNEGFALGAAVAAVRRAVALAAQLMVQCHLVLREDDSITQHWAAQSLDRTWMRLESPDPSLAAARNLARACATAPLVAFVDGQDLWCADWLQQATAAARNEAAIWRPEFLITFARDTLAQEAYAVVMQPDSSRDGCAALLAPERHLAGFLAPLPLLQAEPWPAEDAERGWGLPDPWWSCNLAAHGHAHRTLPGRFHYRRVPWNFDVMHRSPLLPSAERIGPTPLSWIEPG